MDPHAQQQQHAWQLAWPAQHKHAPGKRVYLSPHPGALLLAHIHTSVAAQQQQQQQQLQQQQQAKQQQQQLPPWLWMLGGGHAAASPAAAAVVSDPLAGEQLSADSDGNFCELEINQRGAPGSGACKSQRLPGGSSSSTSAAALCPAPCNQVACVALSPEPRSSAFSSIDGKRDAAASGGSPEPASEQFVSPQQLQQQHPQQQQAAGPAAPPLAHTAAASSSGSSSSSAGGGRQVSGWPGDSPGGGCGLRGLGRALNSEAGRFLGLAGGQLLVHLAALQRGMAALQQHQQPASSSGSSDGGSQQQQQQRPGFWRPRLPWQRADDDGSGGGPGSGGGGRQQQQQQSAAAAARAAAEQWVARGIAAEASLELREALACYTNAVTLVPGDVELLCRLAKQWSDLTYEPGATVEAIQEVNMKAVEYAERAITLAPKAAGGYMASCVSRGRLALFSDNKTKVRLAKEAREAAVTALELEPGNDLAHHLMGRWHFEMAQINFVVRQLIRLVYGAALAPGRFEDALDEFSTAVALNPTKLIHRVELGRTHLRLGHRRQAYEELAASVALPVEDVNAALQKEDAELLLSKLRAEFEGSITWGGGSSSSSDTQQPAAGADAASAASAADEAAPAGSSGSNGSAGGGGG